MGVSTTGGIEYNAFGPTEAQLNSTKFGIRKAAFPSSSTWYATFGSAPAPPPSPPMEGFPEADTHRVRYGTGLTLHVNTKSGNATLTDRWGFGEERAAAFSTPFTALDGPDGPDGPAGGGYDSGYDSGYAMAVAKTTDTGKTWSVVYQDVALPYEIGDISCGSADACVASASGETGALLLSTRDGGSSWSKFQAFDHLVSGACRAPGERGRLCTGAQSARCRKRCRKWCRKR